MILNQSAPKICLGLGKGGEGDGEMSGVSALHLPSLNLDCLLQASETKKQGYHFGGSEMFFSSVFLYISDFLHLN